MTHTWGGSSWNPVSIDMIATIAAAAEKIVSVIVAIDMIAAIATIPGE